MSKYYTPELEEFHTGFIYEVYIEKKDIWSKEEFYMNDSHLELVNRNTVYEKKVRVKHLDREDIENEGFDYVKGKKGQEIFDHDIQEVRIVLMNEGMVAIMLKRDWYVPGGNMYDNIFQGRVKNASEFNRILKQLNIEWNHGR